MRRPLMFRIQCGLFLWLCGGASYTWTHSFLFLATGVAASEVLMPAV